MERDENMKHSLMKTLAGATLAGVVGLSANAQQTVRPAGSIVQDIRVRGRVQTQFGYTDAKNDEGSSDYSTFEVRRARIGLRGTFENNFRAQLEANLVPGSSLSMRSAYIEWRENPGAMIKVGVDKPHSSFEENTSSAAIRTVERSFINGAVAAPGPTNGLTIHGDLGTIYYAVGLYTDENNTNPANEENEYMYAAQLGMKLDDLMGDNGRLRLQASYLGSEEGNGALGFEDVFIIGFQLEQGAFKLQSEYMLGDKDGNEVKGFYVMPSLMLSEKLEGVFRYEQSESDRATGLRAANRYARRAENLAVRTTENADGSTTTFDPQRGNEHMAVYLGLNYYLNGNGNKFMFGVEYSELDGTAAGTLEATTFYAAWRTLF